MVPGDYDEGLTIHNFVTEEMSMIPDCFIRRLVLATINPQVGILQIRTWPPFRASGSRCIYRLICRFAFRIRTVRGSKHLPRFLIGRLRLADLIRVIEWFKVG